MFNIGDKVFTQFGNAAEVVKVFKNGKVQIAEWVQAFGQVKPEIWKTTVKPETLIKR